MSSYGRMRSKEAPMQGLEFTHRPKTVPAWKVDADNENQNTPLKRTHSIANPPPSPFNPKRDDNAPARPILGEGVHFLFNQPQTSAPWPTWATPSRSPDTPEIDMKDVTITPPPAFNSQKELERKEERGAEPQDDDEHDNSSPERRIISNAAVRRLRRRGARGGRSAHSYSKSRLAEVEDVDESDQDEYDGSPPRQGRPVTRNTSNHYTLNMPGHGGPKSETPYILLGYLQFGFNLSLILVFLYLLLQFIFTVQRDVEQRVGEYSMEILQEITTCATLYKQNLCDTTPIPAMLHQCSTWETCMARDPKIVGRAKVGAEMLAEVVNGFVEPISWKTLAFTLSSLAFMTVFVNALLSLFRSRQHPDRISAQHIQPMPMPHFQALGSVGYHPQQNPYGYLHQGQPNKWGPGLGELELETLPRQRRKLENGGSIPIKDDL